MKQKTPFSSFAALPLSSAAGFTVASMIFIFVLHDPSPVPVFIFFCAVNIIAMLLYALVDSKYRKIFQHISRFLIGAALLFFGFAGMQNFQIEGFFFTIMAGVFSGVAVHYLMGKVLFPVIFGRTWCSWSCWTLLVLDLLPFKKGQPWQKGASRLRYLHFALSLILCGLLVFAFGYLARYMQGYDPATGTGGPVMVYWFAGGNALYYLTGIVLAIFMKDNRAFCKYLCPVTVFLKLSNMVALMRIKGDAHKCSSCRACVKACPMHIDIPSFVKSKRRVLSTECVLCLACVAACPEAALRVSAGFDLGVAGGYECVKSDK